MDEKKYCPICGIEAAVMPDQNCFGTYIKCSHCGKFTLEESAERILNENGVIFRNALYFYLTHKRGNSKKAKKFIDLKNPKPNDGYDIITVDEVMQFSPKNISEIIDMVLLNLVEIEDRVGMNIRIENDEKIYGPIFFIESDGKEAHIQMMNFLNMIKRMNLIEAFGIDELDRQTGESEIYIRIDYKGWERIDRLNSIEKSYSQGFIAMWFSPEMNEYRDAIKGAIIKAGYRPMVIDEKPHNNQIVPELLYEIRQSEFLVADLIGNRKGVYYEAGYALGLGKQVIMTVSELDEKKGDDNKPHFDVAQVSQVRYKTVEELEEKLYERIISTIGEGEHKIQ